MTRTVKLLLMSLILICLGGLAVAETTVDVSAQMRARNEVSSKAITGDQETQEATYLRTRVNVAASKENVSAFVQFQDSRTLGAGGRSGGLVDGHNVDLHQAYLTIDHLWNKGIGLKAGRFELNLGNERVFGAVGWDNVGRSWEGFQATYSCSHATTSAYWLKKAELNSSVTNTDFDIIGFSTALNSMNLELFFFIEQDQSKPSMTALNEDGEWVPYYSIYKNLERYDLGLYYQRDYQQFDFTMNAVYQFGKRQTWVTHESLGYKSDEIDIAATMFAFEAGYSFAGDYKPRLALGIDYTSGDDSETLDKVETYDNLYYTGHKFRGYMDYFVGSPTNGLMDFMIRGKVSPFDGWTVKGDLHFFSTTQDYTYDGAETKSVGTELDFTVSTKRVAGVGLTSGLSFFMPSDEFAGTSESNTGTWFYTQAIVGF